MTVKAYSYLRFSSSAQARGDSLRRQLEAAEAWAAARPHIELNTTLRDLGVSAFKGDNRVKGALASFLERIKQGQIERGSYFLLESFDRLSRESESQAIHLLTGITLAGVKVVTLIDGNEYDETADAMELMRALIVMSRSHNENKARTDKVAKAWKEKKEEARRTGKVLSRRGPAWTIYSDVSGRFEPITEKKLIVERIFDECCQGLGITAISQRLNAAGVKPFVSTSDGWHPGYVLTILRSPSVCGYYQPTLTTNRPGQRMKRLADGDAIADYYPRIISDETFHLAQAMIAKRNKRGGGKGRRGKAFPNILLGLGKCPTCSGTLIMTNHPNSMKVRAYRCYQNSRKHRCDNADRYLASEVEEHLMEFLMMAKMADMSAPEEAQTLLVKTSELERAKNRIKNLVNQIEDADVPDPDLVERLAERRLERAALEKEVKALNSIVEGYRPATNQEAVDEACRWMNKVEGDAEPEELYLQRAKANALLNDTLDFVTVFPGGIYTGKDAKGWRVTDELFWELEIDQSKGVTLKALEDAKVVSVNMI